MKNTYVLRIYRGSPGHQYWEEFEFSRGDAENITSSLQAIFLYPYNRKGEPVAPVVYESGCLEEVCGSCSMLINGKPRQACTALIERLIEESGSTTITLAPFTKFPLVRDLIVDRSRMFDGLKQVQAWVDLDKGIDRGPGPKVFPSTQEIRYSLSTCMTCGCCHEACPQINNHSKFIGPAPVSQARLFNLDPVGAQEKRARSHALMQEGGISSCGNAQNCVRVCPKNIPLTDSIAEIGKDVSLQAISDLFGFGEENL